MAIAMDMSPDTHPREVIDEYLRRRKNPIKPILVKDGPCKENIQIGDEVDLLKFPVPMLHGGDGGRYIGTWHATITKELDSDWVNWGMYRHMLHTKNSMGIFLASNTKHFWSMYTRGYKPRNKPMEVAIAIGMEPVSAMCAANPMPYGVSEVDIAGAIRGEPVELVKCETIDLAVPATSEVVIEGEFRPGDMMAEGPFGEFTGYRSGLVAPRPVIHVKAVTHRNNPIFTMSCVGITVDDNCVISLTSSAEFLEILRARGLPVTGVFVPPETSQMLVVVAVKPFYMGLADDVAHTIWGALFGHLMAYIIIVEDDIDPFNMPQVWHALVSKCHPGRGIVKVERSRVSSLIPFLDHHEREYETGVKAYFDCTWPLDWNPADVPERASFAEMYPLEIQERALAKWHKYGY
ncbi:UbiD family decarboxylase [Chloroflexota bacterium]